MTFFVRLMHQWFPPRKSLLIDMERFLGEDIIVLSPKGGQGQNCSVEFRSAEGQVLYDKTHTHRRCVIEGVEIVPREGPCVALTFVNGELSVVRHNGSKPNYSGELSIRESEAMKRFMETLREKVHARFQSNTTAL